MSAQPEHTNKIPADAEITDEVLDTIAKTPTKKLLDVVEEGLFPRLSDRDYMRIATLMAVKSFAEGGCPIGAVVKDNESGLILGKGHNTLIQDNDPTTHGETAAIRDAGGTVDYSLTTLFTTLTPCDFCTALIRRLEFNRVVIGDVTSTGPGTMGPLVEEGLQPIRAEAPRTKVEILQDPLAIGTYGTYMQERPEDNIRDWMGVAAVNAEFGEPK